MNKVMNTGTDEIRLKKSFFSPKSIAFVGASNELETIRGRIMKYAVQNHFSGKVYPISASQSEVQGVKAYPKVSAIGQPVDLAIIAIPAKFVIEAVEDCAKAGVPNVMIIASGFAEANIDQAPDLQNQIAAVAKRTGIRIAGPNCEGFYNAVDHVTASFTPTVEHIYNEKAIEAAPGKRVGVISQSGGQGFAMFTKGRHKGLSFSYVMSSGNEVDLTAADYLEYMVADPNTQIIMMYLESIRDGERFKRAARAAELAGKPIIMVKLGRSDAGARAAASHTASMTGSHATYRAIFRRYGIVEVADPEEAISVAAMFATNGLPAGRRIGIVTVSGGSGAIASDILSEHGLTVPELSAKTQALISPLIPAHASPKNPVDITAQGGKTGPAIMRSMELLEESGEVDMIMVINSTARLNHVSIDPKNIRGVVDRGKVPLAFYTYTLLSDHAREKAAEGGSVFLTELRHLALGFAKLADFADHRRKLKSEAPAAAKPIDLPKSLPNSLTEHQAKELLAPYGLTTAEEKLVTSAEAAAAAAEVLGYPVVMKIQSPDIIHKTEVGGVMVGLRDKKAVADAYAQISASVEKHKPNAKIDGVLVQKMAPKGHELVVGIVDDPTFGPLVMAGLGGIAAELFADVVHMPAPVTIDEARDMLNSLKSAKLFQGFRGAKPIDITPAAEFVSRMSQAAVANHTRIKEMEFNPVILHADGSGLTVADAVVLLKD